MKIDEVGYWSELKLEIIKKYAGAYSQIPRLALESLKTFLTATAGEASANGREFTYRMD